jgi:hypothetical protein
VARPDDAHPQVQGLNAESRQAVWITRQVAVHKHVVWAQEVAAVSVVKKLALQKRALPTVGEKAAQLFQQDQRLKDINEKKKHDTLTGISSAEISVYINIVMTHLVDLHGFVSGLIVERDHLKGEEIH